MRLRHRHPNKVSDNVAVVRGFLSDEVELVSAFADDDRAQMIVSALAAVAHPDFALIDRDSLENAGRPIPLEGYVDAWRHFLECWERLHLVVEDMVEHRNHVVVIARVSGESKVAGIRLEDRRAAVWTFKRGRVLRIEQFTTPAEAFAAAGLPAEADPAPKPFVPSLWLAMAENASASA